MVIRDTRRDIEYWHEFSLYQESIINISENTIIRSNISARHRSSALFNLFMHRLEMLIAFYSQGNDVADLAAYFPLVIESLRKYREEGLNPFQYPSLDSYVQAAWMLSFGILLDISPSDKQRVAALTDYVGTDALLDRLRQELFIGKSISAELIYPDIYQPLLQIFNIEPRRQRVLLQEYLNSYYTKMKPTYWHDRHLLPNKSYFGYWCLEATAVVKLIGLDDSTFREHVYYPADLVHVS